MTEEYQEKLRSFISAALAEDVGEGDHTSLATIPLGKQGTAQLKIKEEGILAGVQEATAIFSQVDENLNVQVYKNDGSGVSPDDIALVVSGNIHCILMAERLVLNVMQRMSGIATATHRMVEAVKDTKAKILDTRKTTPLLRFLEKRAVAVGGGVNHRFGLYDMILIKDNHVDYVGGMKQAVDMANNYRKTLPASIAIEVEVRNFDELKQVLEAGKVDRVMLDNFSPDALKEAVAFINGRLITEASGGITGENVREYADTGVDFISIGALTHSVKSLDMSLKAKFID